MEQKLREALKSLSAKVSEWKGKGLSEADTKRTVIERLLAVLGWDIHDPGEVQSDLCVAGGRVDYALRVGGSLVMLVEAKALGRLAVGDARQLLSYGSSGGVQWCLLSDGCTYELYDSFNTGALAEKLVFRTSIEELLNDDDGAALSRLVQKFSLLSKQAIESRDVIKRAAEMRGEEERKKEEQQRQSQRALAAGAPEGLQGEEEVSALVKGPFRHLEPLYSALRSRIAERMPHLRAELETGGEGWIKFKNPAPPGGGRPRYSHFHLTLKKTKVRIEIWFPDDKHVPSREAVEAKGLESAMHRRSGKGFYISSPEQIDDTLLQWLEAAQ